MATLKMVAVFDKALGLFNRPFFVVALGQAIRSFEDEVNRAAEDNPMWNHARDFALYSIGEYEEETGRATCVDVPVRLCEASDCQSRQLNGGPNASAQAQVRFEEVGGSEVSSPRQAN